MRTELAVLGGGPGGYAAAFLAADRGIETVIIEQRPRLGGVCLFEGCIPSKALLHAMQVKTDAEELAEWGVSFEPAKIDVDTLRQRKEKVIDPLAKGLMGLAKGRKVRVIQARGRLDGERALKLQGEGLDDDRVEFDKLILATGSRPAVPGPLAIDDDRLMDSSGALALPEIPEKLLVVGGGYIGLEMATVYARLGSEVVVVEMLDSLMPSADADLVRPLTKRLKGTLADIRLGTQVRQIKPLKKGLKVTLAGGDDETQETFDRVLVAVGRRPNTEGLGLEAAGVELAERGFVKVDAGMQTSASGIWAIGDCAGEPMLAHKAFHEGYVAAERIAGGNAVFDRLGIPAVVFTDPEVAWVGLAERDAEERGIEVEVARSSWKACGRAHSIGRTEGFSKLLFAKGGQRLLGAAIVGPEAGELIAECGLAIETGATARDLGDTIHTHPTLSETVWTAAREQLGEATE